MHNILFYAAGRIFMSQPEHRRKLDALLKGIRGENSFVRLQKIIYESSPNCWKHFLKNVFAQRFFVGSIKRSFLAWKGHIVPSALCVSLNMPGKGCNLSCKQCYARGHEDAEMEPSLLRKIIKEGEELGIYSMLMVGGEPFLYKGIWEPFLEFPRTTFWVNTNGTLLGEREIEKMAQLGNVLPIISIEGFQKETDAARGDGVFLKAVNTMKTCGDNKILYFASVTVCQNNFEAVTSKEFVEMLVSMRCVGINYSCYVPVGADPHPEWQITNEQSGKLDQWGRKIMEEYPIISTVGRNGTDRVSACYAAKQYMHILPNGDVEPCPFVHYSDLNIKDSDMLDITGSDFFRGVRHLNSLGINGLTPCRDRLLIKKYLENIGGRKTVA